MIEFSSVLKQYGVRDVLSHVSFRINTGERVGIVGPNGAGKSTIFGLIEGGISADRGEVVLPKGARLGHLRQQLNSHEVEDCLLDYTVRAVSRLDELRDQIHRLEHDLENQDASARERMLQRLGELQSEFEHLGGYEMQTRAEAALSGLGFPEDGFRRPFREFSGGWQMRAELARTLIGRPDILLLDEPSNYLDLPAVEWLQRYLREFAGTLMLISHDRWLLESLTTVTLEIAGGAATRYNGNYSIYLRDREARAGHQMAAYLNQQKKKEKVERFVERFRAKSTKASQVQSRIKQLEKMEEIDAPSVGADLSRLRIPPAPHCGTEAIRLDEVGITYDDSTWVLRDLDLTIRRGEKIALVGYNGLGKTTLLRMLAGVLAPSAGRRQLGHKVVVGYQSQDFAETMPPNRSVYDIVRDAHPDGNAKEIRNLLGSFGFGGQDVEKTCAVLSGGEKIRLAFARIFVCPPNLLLLDEPTTHLDIHGREALEKALQEYDGTLCLVSHDVTFVRNVAEQIVAMTPPGVTRYAGNYDYYLEKRDGGAIEAAPSGSSGITDKKAQRKQRAEERKQRAARKQAAKKKVTRAERAIEKREQEQAELMDALATEGLVDYEQTNRRLGELQEELIRLNDDWESAMLELEAAEQADS